MRTRIKTLLQNRQNKQDKENERKDPSLIESFQDFLQINRLGTFGRLVLKKIN